MQDIIINLKNIPGRGTSRKIVVIECDDYGGIRMPSMEVFEFMNKRGLPVGDNRYNSYDTLVNHEDLDMLFEVLLSVTDINGKPAVMTPVTNVANPDFRKIKEAGYTQYFYEPFTETLKRYGREPRTFEKWIEGMKLGIFMPELHGREHISVQFWMKMLLEGNQHIIEAFDREFVSLSPKGLNKYISGFRPEFYIENEEQAGFLVNSIKEGVELFRQIFGYLPNAFVPSNNIFHPIFEKAVAEAGVKFLYVSHLSPVPDMRGGMRTKYYPVGRKNSFGLRYYTRNCAFEPTDPLYRGPELTLKQIEAAFRWRKPANISSHRVNFVGAINKENREKGLKELKNLLNIIKTRWPDVEFMSASDMFKVIYNGK